MDQADPAGNATSGNREWLHASGELALFFLVWFWLSMSRLSRGSLAEALDPPVALAQLSYWLLWVAVGRPFSGLVQRLPLERPYRLRRTALYACLGLVAGEAHGLLYSAVTLALPARVRPGLVPALVGGATYGQLVFWALLVLKHASYYYRSARDAEVRTAQIAEQLARAQVDALKLRIRPAYVMARLRDIALRLRHDPQSADDRVVRLGGALRRRLERAARPGSAEDGDADAAGEMPPLPPRAPRPRGAFDWRAELALLVFWNAAMLGPILGSWYLNTPGISPERLRDRTLELLLHASIWVLVCLPLAPLIERKPIEAPHRLRRLLAYSALGLVLGTAHAVLHFSAARALLGPGATFYASSFAFNLALDLSIGQTNYGIFLFAKHIWYFRRRYHDRLARAAEMRALLKQAQLGALQMQLQPHFLFNTLHAISELAHEDPAAAEQMTTRLADFLRLTFESSDAQLVTLSREMEFLEHYLAIQRIRFADRLRIEIDVAPTLFPILVPSLILQPLVENAIKHGIARRRGGGTVRVRGARTADGLEMQIQDEGAPGDSPGPAAPAAPRMGIGLWNVETRLRRLYGRRSRLHLARNESGGVTVSLVLPADEAQGEPTHV